MRLLNYFFLALASCCSVADPLHDWLSPATENLYQGDFVVLELKKGSFKHSRAITEMINTKLGENTAMAISEQSIRVMAPRDRHDRVSFLAELLEWEYENL